MIGCMAASAANASVEQAIELAVDGTIDFPIRSLLDLLTRALAALFHTIAGGFTTDGSACEQAENKNSASLQHHAAPFHGA